MTLSISIIFATTAAIHAISDVRSANQISHENWNDDVVYSKKVFFEKFNDPGVLHVSGWDTLNFGYRGITYDNISRWKSGRELEVIYSKELGSIIMDPLTGQFSSIPSARVFEEIFEGCDPHQSSMSFQNCVQQHLELLMHEKERIFAAIASNDADLHNFMLDMHADWLAYKNRRYEIGQYLSRGNHSTSEIMDSSSRALWPVIEYLKFLDYLYRNHDQIQ